MYGSGMTGRRQWIMRLVLLTEGERAALFALALASLLVRR